MNSFLDSLSCAFSSIHFIIFLIGVTSNVSLLAAAIQRTPAKFKSYSILIKIGTISDIISVCCDCITMQRLLVVPGNLMFISYGPCTHISVRFCYLMYCLQLCATVYSYYVMLASFIFRLWILHRSTPRSASLISLMIAIAIPPAVVMSWFTSAQADIGFVKEYIREYAPRYLNESGDLSGNFGMTAQLIFTCIYVIVPVVPLYICIIIVRHLILAHLNASMGNISKKTQSLHRILVKALTVHACLPLITSFAVVTYLVLLFDIYYHPALEKAITMFASIPPALGAFCSLYYIEPYKRFASCRSSRNSIAVAKKSDPLPPNSLFIPVAYSIPCTVIASQPSSSHPSLY